MEAKEVVQKILAEAQAKVDKIEQEARSRQDEHKALLDAELADFRKESQQLARRAADDRKSQVLAAARMAASREKLSAKQQQLDELFARVAENIRSMSDAEYRQLMTALMKKAVQHGDEEVLIGRDEKRIDQSLLDEVNRSLGGKGSLKLSQQKASASLGFVLRKENITTNASLAILLEQARAAMEIQLAGNLFA